MRTVRGDEALIHPTTAIQIFLPEYLLFALLGVAAGFLSVWFIRSLSAVERACTRILTMHAALRPAVGGLLAGILAVFMPALLEQTYHPINMALDGGYAWWMLLGVALVKPLHTALTTGSGGTGGSFAPALKSGAMLGALFGAGVMQVFPSMVTSPTAYALAGMGAVLAGTMQAPLTGILMLVEISNNYTIVLPGMLTAILASVIAQRVARRSVYGGALERDGRKEGSYAYLPLLSSLAIEPVVAHDAPRVHLDTPLREVLHDFEASVHDAVLVIDARDRYLGLIEFDDLRPVMSDLSMLDSLVAADVMTTDVTPVRIDTTMDVVLRLHDRKGWRVLPVLDVDDERALGLLAVSDAHTYYRRSVAREV
jgi:CIC family chloride channel protein